MKYLIYLLFLGLAWGGELSRELSGISPSKRSNVEIYFYSQNKDISQTLDKASALWNSGNYEDAIKAVSNIDDRDVIISYSYKNPARTTRWGNEVQVIGSPWKARDVELIKAMNNDNLFIVAKTDTGYGSNRLYTIPIVFSQDNGQSWQTTGRLILTSGTELISVNSAEMDSGLYVALLLETSSHQQYMYLARYRDRDGRYDSNFGIPSIINVSGQGTEMVMEPNTRYRNRLYLFYVLNNHELKYYYAVPPYDPSSWSEVNTGIADVNRGLDAGYVDIEASYFLWVSYINTDSNVVAVGHSEGVWDSHVLGSAEDEPTSIATRGDTVIVLYARHYTDHPGLRYKITYDGGTNWYYGTIAQTTDTIRVSNVTSRGGQGWHVAYTLYHYGSTPEIVKYAHRHYSSGSWVPPVAVSSHDAWANYKPAIEYLGNGKYGIAYIDDEFNVYFNRSDWVEISEPPISVRKPFEFKAVMRNNGVVLRFILPEAGIAKLKIYNVAGELVNSYVISANRGENTFSYGAPSTGIYIARLEFGKKSDNTKFVIVR